MWKTLKTWFLPLLSAAGLVVALRTVAEGQKVDPPNPPVVAPPRNPFTLAVAGAGIVEARGENVSVGSPVPGIVVEVPVSVGDRVEKGAPLFRLDDRSLIGERGVKRASVGAAEKKLQRLRALPRPETLPGARARVAEVKAMRDDAKGQLERWESAGTDRRAISQDDIERRRFALAMTERQLERAQADLSELEAGAWAPDVAVAEAELLLAQADLARVETELDRLVVRAPAAGRVLQRNVRPGEFVPAAAATERPPILLGDVDDLHVRIDIDEGDAPLFVPGAKAYATLKGRPDLNVPLRYVRTEPFVVPKRSLTGLSAERVDTRVLQVIYALEGAPPMALFVGQQVDAFIDADGAQGNLPPRPAAAVTPSTGGRS